MAAALEPGTSVHVTIAGPRCRVPAAASVTLVPAETLINRLENPMSTYLLLITTDTSVPASEEDRAQAPDVEAWWQSLVDSGRYVTGDPLQPASQAATVRVRGGKVQRTDGPFTEAGEVIVGLDVIEADSMAEAVQIAAGHPMAWSNAVEVREFVSMG